ncbi:MAG: lactate utilization protein [Pseudomonadota bacterium]
MELKQTLTQKFRTAAENVSAIVSEIKTMNEALAYTVSLCEQKEACQLLVSGCEAPLSVPAQYLCDQKQQKLIAAPLLSDEQTRSLASLCNQNGIRFIREGMRNYLSGIDIGLTMADFGIAETGTLVVDSSREEVRLATMISEVHVAILPKDRIRDSAFEIEDDIRLLMGACPNYTAFITGASRTADIERVLALGVHGPLELHILLLEDNQCNRQKT